jgi:hypothetical protein
MAGKRRRAVSKSRIRRALVVGSQPGAVPLRLHRIVHVNRGRRGNQFALSVWKRRWRAFFVEECRKTFRSAAEALPHD